LAKQEAELDRQRQLEVAKVQWELNEQAAREAAKLRNEKQVALAKADQEHQGDLAAQRSALEKEKARALSDKEQAFTDKLDQQKQLLAEVSEELAPYVQALEAKKKIIKELDENFKDFDTSAVQIDPKTGKVKLHFQESYFALGSHKLSADMKSFLRIMIPKYAKSIYGNKDAAAHVESLKISGMASPIYQGVYIDINDKSPESEKARKYNMALSNNRANALYGFIFDEDEMGDYEFRSRLEADMSIAALGFQNATPVQDKLVGKPAKCIEYDCKQEQATVLEFRLFTEE
jgi:outer membrane protein OmpA-like peptidoglycan-associated protein